MWRSRLKPVLFPDAERDEGFREELQRRSHISLDVIGYVQITLLLVVLLIRFVISSEPETLKLRAIQAVLAAALGVTTLLLARVPWAYRYSRLIAICSGMAMTAVLVVFSLLISPVDAEAEDFIPSQITIVLLVGVVAIPLRPMQALALGLGTGVIYLAGSIWIAQWQYPARTPDPRHWIFILILTLMATGLTGVVYQQRSARYFAHRSQLDAAEQMRAAQVKIMLSEHAASLGRLSAAVSHDLNSPVGALISGVDTLLLMAARQATAPPSDQPRLVKLQSELRQSVKASADRLRQIVARMQRFTNLDKADVQSADINELVGDVAALLESHWRGKAEVLMDLQPVPALVCRPQKLSAVFYSLINNAIDAVNGDGRIVVSTRHVEQDVEVAIADNGRGVPPGELASIFDPGFKSTGARVATGNWSMFTSRQIIREHGGDISISSGEGKGTIVTVRLPVEAELRLT